MARPVRCRCGSIAPIMEGEPYARGDAVCWNCQMTEAMRGEMIAAQEQEREEKEADREYDAHQDG